MSLMYSIIFEHDDFIVVSKKTGVCIHSEPDEMGLIVALKNDRGLDALFPVHRLDKVTSGLLVCAKTQAAASELSQLFERREVEKFYLAISDQKPKKKQGLVKGDMERSRRSSWKLCHTTTNPARTQFFSDSIGDGKRLYLLKPKTGKTHQLRVALKSIGAPIMGDRLYGHPLSLVSEFRSELSSRVSSRVDSNPSSGSGVEHESTPESSQGSETTVGVNSGILLHAFALSFTYQGRLYRYIDKPKNWMLKTEVGVSLDLATEAKEEGKTDTQLDNMIEKVSQPWELPWPSVK